MTAEHIKKLLPFIEAFANKQPLYVRLPGVSDWTRINPGTTEFQLKSFDNGEFEWSLTGTEQ